MISIPIENCLPKHNFLANLSVTKREVLLLASRNQPLLFYTRTTVNNSTAYIIRNIDDDTKIVF